MPTYDYLCSSCDHELEIYQSITESAKRKCPECSKMTLKRQIGSGGGIIFKGSGFYETDYRSESYKKDAKADKEAATPKTDSKTDKKDSSTKSSSTSGGSATD